MKKEIINGWNQNMLQFFLPNSNSEFLWLSERDGFMNLYKYDINSSNVSPLSNFSWVIKAIVGFDEGGKNVIILGTGNDGRETRAYKINLKKWQI